MRLCACHYRIFCSGDARMGYKQMRLYAFYYRAFCPGDARFCVSTGLTPSLLSTVNVFCDSQSNQSRDAKFCVSQARMRNKLRRLCACHYRIFCPGDARFCVSTGLTPLLSWDKKRASECDSAFHISQHTLPYPITLFPSSRADASSVIC